MKKSQLWIIIVLIAVILGFGVWYIRERVAGLSPDPKPFDKCECPVSVVGRGFDPKILIECPKDAVGKQCTEALDGVGCMVQLSSSSKEKLKKQVNFLTGPGGWQSTQTIFDTRGIYYAILSHKCEEVVPV